MEEDINEIVVTYEVVNDHKSKIWGLIQERAQRSGGHNGIDIAELKNVTGIPVPDIKAVLIELHKEGLTKVREQKNGRAIYVK